MEPSEPVQACTGIAKRNICLFFKNKSKRKIVFLSRWVLQKKVETQGTTDPTTASMPTEMDL